MAQYFPVVCTAHVVYLCICWWASVDATFSWLWTKLLWTFVNKCLFEHLFLTLLFLGLEWQGRMSSLCLALWWTAHLLCTAAAVWLQFLHIVSSAYQHLVLIAAVPVGVKCVSLWIRFAFSWWVVMLSIFSCVICGSSLDESLFKPFAYFFNWVVFYHLCNFAFEYLCLWTIFSEFLCKLQSLGLQSVFSLWFPIVALPFVEHTFSI